MPPASPVASTDSKVSQLALLGLLSERSDLSQRELSRLLGLSLGKTHYVLHALLDKGLVKARNFTRSDNKLGYSYLLTPAGMAEKLRMTREFLARKEEEFEQLKSTIALLRAAVVNEASNDAADESDDLLRAEFVATTDATMADPDRQEAAAACLPTPTVVQGLHGVPKPPAPRPTLTGSPPESGT